MTSDDSTFDDSDDYDDLTFGADCDKHDFRCWSCGKPKADPLNVFSSAFTIVFGLALFVLVCAPLFWIVKVVWGRVL
jgi:hypothetical protein